MPISNDGWNIVAQFTSMSTTGPTMLRSAVFTWGLDLSGTLQGAGGVGGLLVQSNGAGTVIERASYDGNGNITAWTNSTATAPTSRREYDAFGNTLVSEGASPSAFGFSTKMQDVETGLYYYGYRFYDPLTGRWPSRDPIEERGGVNLYGFVRNSPVSLVDILGKKPTKEEGLEGLAKATAALYAVCDKCCPSKKCKTDKDKCKKEADSIVKSILNVWEINYGKGEDTSEDNIGGYLCWDWTKGFKGAIENLKLESWRVEERMSKSKTDPAEHYWIELYACKKNKDECTVIVDDGWLIDGTFVHSPPFPKKKDRWDRDQRRNPPRNYTRPPIKY